MSDLDVGGALVMHVSGPAAELRFVVPLHSNASYSLCLHDGMHTTLDASVVVRGGVATLRTREGGETRATLTLADGVHATVGDHRITVAAERPALRVAGLRPISRQHLNASRVDRLLATLEEATRQGRDDDAEAAFSAVRSAIDRAHTSDGYFTSPAFSRLIARLGALAATRCSARWTAWILETLLRCSRLPDARAIDQLVFLPTDALVGNERALEELMALVARQKAPLSTREERLRETVEVLLGQLRARGGPPASALQSEIDRAAVAR